MLTFHEQESVNAMKARGRRLMRRYWAWNAVGFSGAGLAALLSCAADRLPFAVTTGGSIAGAAAFLICTAMALLAWREYLALHCPHCGTPWRRDRCRLLIDRYSDWRKQVADVKSEGRQGAQP